MCNLSFFSSFFKKYLQMNEAYKANFTLSRLIGTKFVEFPYKPEEDIHDTLREIDEKMGVYCSKLR